MYVIDVFFGLLPNICLPMLYCALDSNAGFVWVLCQAVWTAWSLLLRLEKVCLSEALIRHPSKAFLLSNENVGLRAWARRWKEEWGIWDSWTKSTIKSASQKKKKEERKRFMIFPGTKQRIFPFMILSLIRRYWHQQLFNVYICFFAGHIYWSPAALIMKHTLCILQLIKIHL